MPEGLVFDHEAVKKAYELHSSDKVGLGESAGLLPDLSTIGCSSIDKVVANGEKFYSQVKISGEAGEQLQKWMTEAKKKQEDCKAVITPIPKKRLSKNLTPIVIIAGAVVAGIIVSKIFYNEK